MRSAWVPAAKVERKMREGWAHVSAAKAGEGAPPVYRDTRLGREYFMQISDIGYARARIDVEGPYWQEFDSAAWTGRPDWSVRNAVSIGESTTPQEQAAAYRKVGWIS